MLSRTATTRSGLSPFWALAADAVVETEYGWGQPDPTHTSVYDDLPPHRDSSSPLPAGGNEVFADGSAKWYKAKDMGYLTIWNTDGSRNIISTKILRTFRPACCSIS